MARGIVQSKPFIKQRSQQSDFNRSKIAGFSRKVNGKKVWFFSLLSQKYWAIIGIIVLLSFLTIYLLKGTIYNPSYQIKTINYTQETRKKYENTELFVLASKFLRGKYYSTLKVGGESELLNWVKTEYPFVKSVKITYTNPQEIAVDFSYIEPDFIIKLGDKRFWVWQDGVTDELLNSRTLGQTWFIVDTPSYLTGTTSLAGFFYDVSYDRYTNYLPQIQETFPEMKRFVYLAGSSNFIIFEGNKMIFLHRDNVAFQLEKYLWLKKNFQNFAGVTEIDLGSLTQEKVIIRE